MNARERLVYQLSMSGHSMAQANDWLDAYTHALAEAIRREASWNPAIVGGAFDGWSAAANMIDPEVED